MKNIKFLFILMLQLALVQLTYGQEELLNNGRAPGVLPNPPAQTSEVTTPQVVQAEPNRVLPDGMVMLMDQDIPRAVPMQEPTVFPFDFDNLRDEILNSGSLSSLENSIADLEAMFDELRQENQQLRSSLNNCCTLSEQGLTSADAYLVQNRPNPFNATSEVRYFVPEGLSNVTIDVLDVNGVLLKTFEIDQAGYGQLELDGRNWTSGSYLYYLKVDGEAVDSKVMILNK